MELSAIGADGRNAIHCQLISQYLGRWGEVFGDDTVAAAMIDRLVHHAGVMFFILGKLISVK